MIHSINIQALIQHELFKCLYSHEKESTMHMYMYNSKPSYLSVASEARKSEINIHMIHLT